MGRRKVVDLEKARERRSKRRIKKGFCPTCGQGGAHVWAHRVHCSDRTTDEKIEAMTGHYGLSAERARETVEAWERQAEVRELHAHLREHA